MFLEDVKNNNSFSLFFLVLLLYESVLIIKFCIAIVFTLDIFALFYLSTAFTCLIAVFFIIYNVENGPVIKLKSKFEIQE